MADSTTSHNQLDPVGAQYHPPLVEENDQWQGGNHGLLELEDTKEITDADGDDANVSELGNQAEGGKPRHAGFWHHDMVNVRLHVIKLWARTGENFFSTMHRYTQGR